jgi:hypothetical protein
VFPAAVVDAEHWLDEDDAAGPIEPLIAQGPWRGSDVTTWQAAPGRPDGPGGDVTARFAAPGSAAPDRPSAPDRSAPADRHAAPELSAASPPVGAEPATDRAWWQPPPAPPVSPLDRPVRRAPVDEDDMASPSEAAWFHAPTRPEDGPGDPDDEHDSGDAWRRP